MNSSHNYSHTSLPDAPSSVPEAKERAAPKLSTVPRGYWRNRWSSERVVFFINDPPKGPGEWLSKATYSSNQIAETVALRKCKKLASVVKHCGIKYLGPVFFPESGGAA